MAKAPAGRFSYAGGGAVAGVLVFGGKTVYNDLRRFYWTLFRQAGFWKIGVIEPPIQVFLKPPLLRGGAISTAPPSTLSATGSAPAYYGIA